VTHTDRVDSEGLCRATLGPGLSAAPVLTDKPMGSSPPMQAVTFPGTKSATFHDTVSLSCPTVGAVG
jgi:hypothetical protein